MLEGVVVGEGGQEEVSCQKELACCTTFFARAALA